MKRNKLYIIKKYRPSDFKYVKEDFIKLRNLFNQGKVNKKKYHYEIQELIIENEEERIATDDNY